MLFLEERQIVPLIYIELGALALSVLFAFVVPRLGHRWLKSVAKWFVGVASQRTRAIAVVGVLTFGISAGLSVVRWPLPKVQDEFSYLLAADTFAQGRVTNPTPPLWEHFESKHILVKPTYQSKYPPAQGLALAWGQFFTGQPLVGAWVSMALAAAALCWMLQAWFPARWALLGSLLAVLHFGVLGGWVRGRFFYWSQSYWGGAVAMLGGALVFGALRRVIEKPRVRDSLLLGLGLVILANSRPYEGLLASLPVAVLLVSLPLRKKGPSWQEWLTKLALPTLCVLAVGAGALGYYNFRVTGYPLKMPYVAHEKTAGMQAHFLLNRAPQRTQGSENSLNGEREEGGNEYLVKEYKRRFQWLYFFYLGPLLTLPFLFGAGRVKSSWSRYALGTCLLVLAGNLIAVAGFPHYLAPVACLVVVLTLEGLRRLHAVRWNGTRLGRSLTRGLVGGVILTFVAAIGLHVYYAKFAELPTLWSYRRAEVISWLDKMPGKQLVLVRGPKEQDRARNDEWVYNGADIEGSKIVWARDLGPAKNTQLFRYFKDRELFFLKADTQSLTFTRIEKRKKF